MEPQSASGLLAAKKAVLFDLFHTLTSRESEWATHPATSEFLGVSREDWNTQLLEKSRDRLAGIERDPYRIIEKMARAIDPSIPDSRIREAVSIRLERFRQAVINIPAATVNAMKKLKGMAKKLGLISNADTGEIAAWPESPLAPLFDSTVFSCYCGFVKPEMEIYRLGMTELGVGPAECVFVGDGGSDELRGAKEAGMSTIMVTGVVSELWPDKIEGRKKDADFTIKEIYELVK